MIDNTKDIAAQALQILKKKVSVQRLWILLEQCIFAGAFATESNHAALRADHRELQMLSEEISCAAIAPARGAIFNWRNLPDARHLSAPGIAGVARDCTRSVSRTSGTVSAVVTSANTTRIV